MTLANKIINLRKQKGWSQEELAEKLEVTRQSVSKWESAQSVPDISKILQISEIFGVTTDYLLKEDLSEKADLPEAEQSESVRTVEKSEAEEYLGASRAAAGKIALGVFLCIISPVTLLLLIGACGAGLITAISEDICVLIGLVALLLTVAAAVIVFILFGLPLAKFDYMEKESINLSREARAYLAEEKECGERGYIKRNAIGVSLCILGAVLTLIGAFTENEMLLMIGISATLLLVACGVYLFVSAGVPWGAMQKMLEDGDFTRHAKKAENIMEPISSAYWLTVTGAYLGYSFISTNWHISWVIWPVAAVLFGVISAIVSAVLQKRK